MQTYCEYGRAAGASPFANSNGAGLSLSLPTLPQESSAHSHSAGRQADKHITSGKLSGDLSGGAHARTHARQSILFPFSGENGKENE